MSTPKVLLNEASPAVAPRDSASVLLERLHPRDIRHFVAVNVEI
jgi:hypothetical protein